MAGMETGTPFYFMYLDDNSALRWGPLAKQGKVQKKNRHGSFPCLSYRDATESWDDLPGAELKVVQPGIVVFLPHVAVHLVVHS